MFHLPEELSGIVLLADTFGFHLKDGRTIDDDLEQRHFEAAGEVLTEVWSNLVIDDNSVKAEYVWQTFCPADLLEGAQACV